MPGWCSVAIRESKKGTKIYRFRFAIKIIIASVSTALCTSHPPMHCTASTQSFFHLQNVRHCACYLRAGDLKMRYLLVKWSRRSTKCSLNLNHLFLRCLRFSRSSLFHFFLCFFCRMNAIAFASKFDLAKFVCMCVCVYCKFCHL